MSTIVEVCCLTGKEEIEVILNVFNKRTSQEALKDAINEILPKKNSIISFAIILLISFVLSIKLYLSDSTVDILENIVQELNGVVIALFGILFTGYSFFQALVDKDLLVKMLKEKGNKKSYFQITNEYFLNVMLLYGIDIFVNVSVMLVFCIFKDLFSVISGNKILILSFILLVAMYFVYNLLLLWEMKSFIFNIFQLFNIHSVCVYTKNKK